MLTTGSLLILVFLMRLTASNQSCAAVSFSQPSLQSITLGAKKTVGNKIALTGKCMKIKIKFAEIPITSMGNINVIRIHVSRRLISVNRSM